MCTSLNPNAQDGKESSPSEVIIETAKSNPRAKASTPRRKSQNKVKKLVSDLITSPAALKLKKEADAKGNYTVNIPCVVVEARKFDFVDNKTQSIFKGISLTCITATPTVEDSDAEGSANSKGINVSSHAFNGEKYLKCFDKLPDIPCMGYYN